MEFVIEGGAEGAKGFVADEQKQNRFLRNTFLLEFFYLGKVSEFY